jgi:hypothetical protein
MGVHMLIHELDVSLSGISEPDLGLLARVVFCRVVFFSGTYSSQAHFPPVGSIHPDVAQKYILIFVMKQATHNILKQG